jgi:hypothetical protein
MSPATCRGTQTHSVGEAVDDEPMRGEVVDDEPARGGVVDDERHDEPHDVPRDVQKHSDAWRSRSSQQRAARRAEAPGRAAEVK